MLTQRRQPAEWAPHDAVWIGWPSAADLWRENLDPARKEVEALVRAIVSPAGEKGAPVRGERIELLARGEEAIKAAQAMRARTGDPSAIRIHEAPIGDIWLRDTGPIFTISDAGEVAASAFQFNGWGGKYELASDEKIAGFIAAAANVRLRRFEDVVAEGGAIEVDGEGTAITTRQCLLNANRNPSFSETDIEGALKAALGVERVIWLDEGLIGDHTDGHVDNLARFIAPGKVVCMRPSGSDDPHADILRDILSTLAQSRDAAGRRLEVIEIPSPGRALVDGAPAPASHMNFYLSNQALIMPSYETMTGRAEEAAAALSILKTSIDREYFHAIDSAALLTGGGSFHCITQQQPTA